MMTFMGREQFVMMTLQVSNYLKEVVNGVYVTLIKVEDLDS